MAAGTFYGTNYAKTREDGNFAKIDPCNGGGNIRCVIDHVFFGADTDLGTLGYVAKLPQGAVPLFTLATPIASTGIATVMSTPVTFIYGISTDTNLLGSITAMNASYATQVKRVIVDGTTYTGMTPLDGNKDAYLTSASAATTEGEGIEIKTFYMLD